MQLLEPQLFIENRTFDEIQLGEQASLSRTLSRDDIQAFAVISGDVNPAHVDEEYARSDPFHKIIAHGMWGASLISTLLGTRLPGPGTIYVGQTLRFRAPVAVGDTITVTVTALAKDDLRHRITFDCNCLNQLGQAVITGSAEVIAPVEKVRRPRVSMPELHLHAHGILFRHIVASAQGLEPIRMAIVHPVSTADLRGAIEAARARLIVPVLVGPEDRIRSAAVAEHLDIAEFELVPTEHSHAAAVQAVALARSRRVDALMQGSLEIDELMQAVVAPDTGLRTDRSMAHVFVMDVPTYPRPLFVTDAVVNVDPDLETKRDIVQNAIDLAHSLGVQRPRVAVLSAIERVDPKLRSSLDAAALTKMADRGQITGGVIDGPLAFDDAVSPEAAHSKGIISAVAGCADILVVANLESGNILVRQLQYLADSQAVGIVLGGRAPVLLSSVSTSPAACDERSVSCALALRLVRARDVGS